MIKNKPFKLSKTRDTQRCYCESPSRIVNFVAPAGCADDNAAVAALPDTWTPKHGGHILGNYLKEREKNHNKVLTNITDGAAAVNGRIETRVRALAELLLAHIQQNQLDIDCVVEKCDEGDDTLSTEARNEALKRIHKLFSQRVEDMSSFKREAFMLERERADGLRIVLRDQFQRLIAVGHRPPKDLLHEFDERIYEINQQLLSNSRAYVELEAQLRFQADESVVRARSELNQLCLGGNTMHRGRSALPWFRQDRNTQPRGSQPLNGKRESSAPSIGLFLGDVEQIEACVSRLVEAYRAAVIKVFTGFSGKLNDLENDLCNHYTVSNHESHNFVIVDLQNVFDRTLRRLSSSVHKKNSTSKDSPQTTSTDVLSMQKSLWSLGECLRDTYTVLHDAGHLWDAHMLRSGLAQKLTIAAVEDLQTSHDVLELANEVNFNIALEQMRCSSDPDKLQQQYESMKVMLDRAGEQYLQHREAELGRLDEFMNLPSSMASTLLSEFDCFLEKHRRSPSQTAGSTSNEPGLVTSVSAQVHSLHSPLLRAILQTGLQEVALRNWRNGFLESFENNVSLVPDELRHQARLWVEEKAGALHMRYSLKLVSHSIRAERVKAAHDARLAELRFHEARLESHLKAIYNLVNGLPLGASDFLSLESAELYPFCQWLSRIQADMDIVLSKDPPEPEFKKLKMSSYAPRLIKHRRLFEESLDAAIEVYKKQIGYRIQEARVSNVRFLHQITLFNEGGRYAAQEAAKTCNLLVKGSDALETCTARSMDALHHRRAHLLALADQQLHPLQKIVDEAVKGGKGSKGVQDKKKQPPAKKK